MLATICDDTWSMLNTQHIIPNSKRWIYSDIAGGGHKSSVNKPDPYLHMMSLGHSELTLAGSWYVSINSCSQVDILPEESSTHLDFVGFSWVGQLHQYLPNGFPSQRAKKCMHVMTSSWCTYEWIYRQTSNISFTKSQNWNVSPLNLQLSLPNPLKPGVKSRMKM